MKGGEYMKNKKLIAVILALGIIASAGYFGTTYALAEETTPGYSTLVQKIAQKFNLKESDVQAVFDSVRDERKEQHKATLIANLDKAVADGVITEAQKQALLTKMQEKHDSRVADRVAFKTWLKDQGIDGQKLAKYLMPGRGRHFGFKFH